MAELESDFPGLNPDDPTAQAWRTPIPNVQGDRPPVLIHLNRYPLALSSHGIATSPPWCPTSSVANEADAAVRTVSSAASPACA